MALRAMALRTTKVDVSSPLQYLTRRRFLRYATAASAGFVAASCAQRVTQGDTISASSSSNSASNAASNTDPKSLSIFTWSNYIDEQLVQEFKDKTGISVRFDVFDSNEAMLAKYQAGGADQYSIIYAGDYMVPQMVELNLLNVLDQARIKGLENLRSQWQDPVYDRGNRHSVPTNWGTTGLIYDPALVGGEIKSWQDLWADTEKFARKVTLVNDMREVTGATLLALGHAFNSENADEIKAVYAQLAKFKSAIAAFLSNGWETQLVAGDVLVSMGYSQDATSLIAEHPNFKYVIPETGGSVWSDTVVIPKTAPNVDAAYEWINFLLEPEVSKGLVERLNLATPNQKSFDLLPAEMKAKTSIFPEEGVLAKCGTSMPIGQEALGLIERSWTELTS
jgi:spermidine/putrescine transport system substrate-binding protein